MTGAQCLQHWVHKGDGEKRFATFSRARKRLVHDETFSGAVASTNVAHVTFALPAQKTHSSKQEKLSASAGHCENHLLKFTIFVVILI